MKQFLPSYRPFGQPAEGYVLFGINKQPVSGQTVTINGDVYVFGTDFNGNSAMDAASSLASAVNADPNNDLSSNDVIAKPYFAAFYGRKVKILATEPGTGGNSITLATNVGSATLSGATLAGGTNGAQDGAIPVTTYTYTRTAVTSSGTVAAGSRALWFELSSDFTGTILGQSYDGSTTLQVNYPVPPFGQLAAINYTVTTGTLYIIRAT